MAGRLASLAVRMSSAKADGAMAKNSRGSIFRDGHDLFLAHFTAVISFLC